MLFVFLSSWLLLIVSVVNAKDAALTEMLIDARKQGQAIPLLSQQQPLLDVELAYQIQHEYVEHLLKKDKVAGFKAGLTSRAGQTKFDVNAPVAGVLLESGRRVDGNIIKREEFTRLMLETEIGFIVGKKISHPLKNTEELRAYIRAVLPVIELPDLAFSDLKKMSGVDIIAANVVSKQFIIGEERSVDEFDLNAVSVSLLFDNEVINTGKGSEAMGDQWQAVLWLVNTMIENGWTIEPDYLVITGALGGMLPSQSGHYVADYGSFGKITFDVN